jgi:NNP family nitrate/nitrite transporter-like MFS transporter
VGASVTKFIGPALITAVPAAGFLGFIPGGWRFVPFLYMVLLLIMAAVTWFGSPRHDIVPGQGRSLGSMLAAEADAGLAVQPVLRRGLRRLRRAGGLAAQVLRGRLRASLSHAALLTALFIFPASLLRPVGGWISDRVGARRVMYATFGVMLVATGILMMPYGYIVIEKARRRPRTRSCRGRSAWVPVHPARVHHRLCDGHRQGRGLQAHPRVLPQRRGRGRRPRRLDRCARRVLPAALFAYATAWTGAPQATFGVLFVTLTLVPPCGCTGPS